MNLNIPTLLTLTRIALIPILAIFFYLPWEYSNIATTFIFIVAGITDWLDGYLARKMQVETKFGAFLDPVADKIMVAFVLVLLVQAESSIWMTLPAAVIIGREITISSLREWMAQIGQHATVKVSQIGKWKTTAQMIAIGCLLYSEEFVGVSMQLFGLVMLYIAAILTLWSMMSYLKVAYSSMTN
ncbi:CDP-diacylglycerol--glycerol-3-phosphate 3-phosphatidyltransferase [Methyloprofundus sedimenti]|uniref:CDP-diacylglycerol--glycerol-3-phosphate 3-phosphatidyltransferase n=1 Tax=Methyloprofundus sedimenti TaxID=1420851 RepID=A0A1V8MB58_9GAMM|nr:CDP-diacylglycerol--glycerol-3-phosphate 3-phosphatidyltransferase [Methyloprofundus sedimenti]